MSFQILKKHLLLNIKTRIIALQSILNIQQDNARSSGREYDIFKLSISDKKQHYGIFAYK